MALITIVEYAQKVGKTRSTVYKKYLRGGFKTAVKRGRDIWIDESEPYTDERVKTGSYIGFRDGYAERQRVQKARAVKKKKIEK